LGLPGGFNETMQNVVGPILVAMAAKFGLGTEIQSPAGLLQFSIVIQTNIICSQSYGSLDKLKFVSWSAWLFEILDSASHLRSFQPARAQV